MIFHPEHVLDFGVNKCYRLFDVYHYEPTYVEFLIEFIQNFEIDVSEFEALPKPVEYYKAHTVKSSTGEIIEFSPSLDNRGAIEPYLSIETENLREFEYKFPQKPLEILLLKVRGEYVKKEYNRAAISPKISIQDLLNHTTNENKGEK